jgi:hypothetical protein
MIMNTRRFVAGLALATALSFASPLHAQVLGGNVNSAVSGTLSGGTRGVDAMARGSIDGSVGVDARDAGRIRDRATDVSGRVQQSTRATADHTRANVQSKVEQAQDTSASVATHTAVTAKGTAEVAGQKADATARSAIGVAGSAKSNVDSTAASARGSVDSADLSTDGSRTRASTNHNTRAKGNVSGERLDVDTDANASASAEAEVSAPR